MRTKAVIRLLIFLCLIINGNLFAADIELTLDTPTNGTIAGADEISRNGDLGETQYFIVVPSGTTITALKIDLEANPPTHDINLFARLDERIIEEEDKEFTFDFRSRVKGAGVESVTIASPVGGKIFIGILNAEMFPVDFTLTATATDNPNGFDVELTSGKPLLDTITTAEFFGDGNGKQYFIDVPDGSTGLRVTLESVDPNVDFFLFVRFGERVFVSRPGVFIFSIDPRFQADLDAGFVSEDLQQQFADYSIFLANNTPISVTDEDGEWRITKLGNVFFIRKEENQLNVYQMFFLDFVSFLGGIESVTLFAPLRFLSSGRYYIGVGHTNDFDTPFTLTATATADPNGFDVELTSGKPVFDIATDPVSVLVEKQYFINVPVDATELTVELSAETADINLDLYIRLDSRVEYKLFAFPSATADFAAETPDIASESITINSPLAGRYYIGIVNWQGVKGNDVPFRITATLGGIAQTLLWDLNRDGVVNILDLVAVGSQFGQRGVNLSADVNADGAVDILDLVTVGTHFGEPTNPAAPTADGRLIAK